MENDETTRVKQIAAQHPEEIEIFERVGLLSKEDAAVLQQQYPALAKTGTFDGIREMDLRDASFDEIIAALESEGCEDLARELHTILYAPE